MSKLKDADTQEEIRRRDLKLSLLHDKKAHSLCGPADGIKPAANADLRENAAYGNYQQNLIHYVSFGAERLAIVAFYT